MSKTSAIFAPTLDSKMKSTKEYLALLTQFKQNMAQQFGIRSIGIFGSVARGEQRPDSDVDVFVELENPDYFIMCDIQESLETIFGCKVDLVRMRNNLQSVLLNNIVKDGIYA